MAYIIAVSGRYVNARVVFPKVFLRRHEIRHFLFLILTGKDAGKYICGDPLWDDCFLLNPAARAAERFLKLRESFFLYTRYIGTADSQLRGNLPLG